MPPKTKKPRKSPKDKTKVPAGEGKKTPAKKKAVKKTTKTKGLIVTDNLFSTPKTRTPSPLLSPATRFKNKRSLTREFDLTAAATSTSDLRPRVAAAHWLPF
jgi:hypothetical protein